jgi:hypothetical protein
MARKKHPPKWAPFAIGGALVLIGVAVFADRASAKSSPTPPMPPPPPPPGPPPPLPQTSVGWQQTPPKTDFLALITDPVAVRQRQSQMANGLAHGDGKLIGMSTQDYTKGEVDGNPNNPRWRRVLAAFQAWTNPALTAAVAAGRLPAGYPAQLRTDGILDQATDLAISLG